MKLMFVWKIVHGTKKETKKFDWPRIKALNTYFTFHCWYGEKNSCISEDFCDTAQKILEFEFYSHCRASDFLFLHLNFAPILLSADHIDTMLHNISANPIEKLFPPPNLLCCTRVKSNNELFICFAKRIFV